MSVHVISVELSTIEAGIDFTITIRRIKPPYFHDGYNGDARDVPSDIADGLREWLKAAPTSKAPGPDPTTEEKVATAVGLHRVVAAGPAFIMCACDMQRRDVITYNAHLRTALGVVKTHAIS